MYPNTTINLNHIRPGQEVILQIEVIEEGRLPRLPDDAQSNTNWVLDATQVYNYLRDLTFQLKLCTYDNQTLFDVNDTNAGIVNFKDTYISATNRTLTSNPFILPDFIYFTSVVDCELTVIEPRKSAGFYGK